jgi:hypothetical protein
VWCGMCDMPYGTCDVNAVSGWCECDGLISYSTSRLLPACPPACLFPCQHQHPLHLSTPPTDLVEVIGLYPRHVEALVPVPERFTDAAEERVVEVSLGHRLGWLLESCVRACARVCACVFVVR